MHPLKEMLRFQENQGIQCGQVAQQDVLMWQWSQDALVAQGISRRRQLSTEAISTLGEEVEASVREHSIF